MTFLTAALVVVRQACPQMNVQRCGRGRAPVTLALLLALGSSFGMECRAAGYARPPAEIESLLGVQPTPLVVVDPTNKFMLLAERLSMPPIEDLMQPMVRIGVLQLNPLTNGPYRPRQFVGLKLKRLDTLEDIPIALESGLNIGYPAWAPDGEHFAFTLTRSDGIELWVGDAASGDIRRYTEPVLNEARGRACEWMPDGRSLVCKVVPQARPPIEFARARARPMVLESGGDTDPHTYVGTDPAPERAFLNYYLTSQLIIVDIDSGHQRSLGDAGEFTRLHPSPDGRYLLLTRVERTGAAGLGRDSSGERVEVWDTTGRRVCSLSEFVLADAVGRDDTRPQRRAFGWRVMEPATLVWAEALSELGATQSDRLMQLAAPCANEPTELFHTQYRFAGIRWIAPSGQALVNEYQPDSHRLRTWLVEPTGTPARLVWDRSVDDEYRDPGTPIRGNDTTGSVLTAPHGWVYLSGTGPSPNGAQPFLNRLDLNTLSTERVWESPPSRHEVPVRPLSNDGRTLLIRHETQLDPPTYSIVNLDDGSRHQVTHIDDPAPEFRAIRKQLLRYERADGVPLSASLYLPADRAEGERLPLLIWVYPKKYYKRDAAGQTADSINRFTMTQGLSPLALVTQGYAVMVDASMPILGDPGTANDTFLEQTIANAVAAIDKAVALGVADRDRVAIGGHSYGAFTVVNLLAHSDLFKTGIAASGAYNRTLTPFGFQDEKRTLWEAPRTYVKMSPLMYADKIDEPLLLIHGEADNNLGTLPMQSERLYRAVQAHGGIVRLVMLPFEGHIYRARDSILHSMAEIVDWLDRHVKGTGSTEPQLARGDTPQSSPG